MKVPTQENVDAARRIRSELLFSWKPIDALLYGEFNRIPKNVDRDDVAYKVTLVGSLYGCNLPVSAEEFVNPITDNGAEIDDELHNGKDPISLVEKIKDVRCQKVGGMRRNNLGIVFASKYCHFHRRDKFPIYDQFAARAVEDIRNNKVKNNYREFYSNVNEILRSMSETGVSLDYKELDEYLWVYGQWLAHKEWLDHPEKKKTKPIYWVRIKQDTEWETYFLKLLPK